MDLNHDISCQSWPLVNHGEFEAKQSLLLREKTVAATGTDMMEKKGRHVMRPLTFGTWPIRANFDGIAHSALS